MKTEPIYLMSPYQKECTSEVIEVLNDNNEFRVILDQTVFYPMGGGQPTDQGKFILEDGSEIEVYQVLIKDGEINHYVKKDNLSVGMKVNTVINWERRFKHMRIHSAGHVIDFALHALGYSPEKLNPLKGDHGKKPFIVYAGKLDEDITQILQSKVNELINSNLKFSWEFKPLNELQNSAIYLQPGLPENKPLRALTLEGVGTVADGGTIVENTSEVGELKIEKIEEIEGNTIIHYSISEVDNLQSKQVNSDDKAETSDIEGGNELLDKYAININQLNVDLENDINSAKDQDALTLVWRKYLGKEGIISNALKNISQVANEDKKNYGRLLNEIKVDFDTRINNSKNQAGTMIESEYLKQKIVNLDYKKPKVGHLHPLTQTTNDLNEIFVKMGYSIMDGPEIESDEYCFQRLNLPMDHPARDLQDSIFVEEPNILLRTQTSSIEARLLETFKPPFKVVMPGRVYRNEKVNRSNHFTFHQYQLTVVKEKVSMAELFATINHLFQSYYGDDVEIRFRCKYYPEVEPGVGPDMRCFNCKGSGILEDESKCQVCKGRGWIEMGGAGIIHPNVLKMAGLDPTKWQGYAFGMGLDRWAMAKHKITDIRTMLGGNVAYKPNVR